MSMQIQELFAYTPDWIVTGIPKISLINMMNTLRESVGDFYEANPGTSVFLFAFMLYYVYYLRNVVKKPELICSNETFRNFLVENCPIIEEEFKPTVWCASHHGQTLLSNTIRMAIVPIPQYRREFVPVDDEVPPKPSEKSQVTKPQSKNSVVTLDWYEGPGPTIQLPDGQKFYAELLKKYDVDKHVYSPTVSEDNGKPIAVFFPGLVGDSQTEYVRTAVIMANSLGYKTCVFNNRSRGGLALRTPRLYCAANFDDLEASLKHIKLTHPDSKIAAVGISLGGIVLCRYLAERGEEALVDAALLVSVCFDFKAGLASLTEPGFNSMLNLHLTKSLIRLVEENRAVLEATGKYNIDEIIASKNLAQFDERFTHKMWNYSSMEEYHDDASNKNRIHKIRKPTLCINAADDIFCPYSALPLKQIQDNPRCAMLVTARGGHIGWMDTNLAILKPELFYLERLIVQFLAAVKNKTSEEILTYSTKSKVD
jgi:abhydrolase domain-containing protein 1/3